MDLFTKLITTPITWVMDFAISINESFKILVIGQVIRKIRLLLHLNHLHLLNPLNHLNLLYYLNPMHHLNRLLHHYVQHFMVDIIHLNISFMIKFKLHIFNDLNFT